MKGSRLQQHLARHCSRGVCECSSRSAGAADLCVGHKALGCKGQNCARSVDIFLHKHQQSVRPALRTTSLRRQQAEVLHSKSTWLDVKRRGSNDGFNRHVTVGAHKGSSCCYPR